MVKITPKGSRSKRRTPRKPRKGANGSLARVVASSKSDDPPFYIRLRNAPHGRITVREAQQGLIEIAGALTPFRNEDLYIDWATVSMSIRDAKGNRVYLDSSGNWEIPVYKSAADEFKL